MRNDPLLTTKDMHSFFESVVVIGTLGLQAYLIDIHHDTYCRSILEGDSIPLMSKTCIRSCSGKGAGLWLVVRPSVCSFCITRFTFTSALCFRSNLSQPSASSFFTCECGHGLDAYGMHLARCPFGS